MEEKANEVRLSAAKDKDLAGFRIVTGYYAELRHSQWGMFPALVKETKQMVVSSTSSVIDIIIATLPNRRCDVKVIPNLLVDYSLGLAFDLRCDNPCALAFITEERLGDMLGKDSMPFIWAPGLL
jgi:hypothetical protein